MAKLVSNSVGIKTYKQVQPYEHFVLMSALKNYDTDAEVYIKMHNGNMSRLSDNVQTFVPDSTFVVVVKPTTFAVG